MSDAPYRYTSGRMLHYSDCVHFETDQPPRLATSEELTTLPVCGTCARAAPPAGSRPTGRFTCPSCHMSHPISLRTASGFCSECA